MNNYIDKTVIIDKSVEIGTKELVNFSRNKKFPLIKSYLVSGVDVKIPQNMLLETTSSFLL